MKTVFLVLCCMLLGICNQHAAVAQIQTGTLIAWMATDSDFVIAADSRTNCIGCSADHEKRDDACKIHVLKGDLVFALAGVDGDTRTPGEWDAEKIAADLASSRRNNSPEALVSLAKDWIRAVAPLAEHSCETTNFPPGRLSQTFTTAIFAEMDDSGKVQVAQAYFAVDPIMARARACIGTPTVETINVRAGEGLYHLAGSGADYVQKYSRDPENVLRERTNLRPAHGFRDPADLIRATSRLVQIGVEQSGEAGDVGGPVDQVHLSWQGIQWVHKKDVCPESE